MRRLSFCFKFVKDSFRELNVCFLCYFDFNKFNRTVNMTIIQYNYLRLQRSKAVASGQEFCGKRGMTENIFCLDILSCTCFIL